MGLLPTSLLVLIYAFPYRGLVLAQPTSSGAVSLPSEISRILPTCALKCFESFVELNFLTRTCSTTPTLDCLCSHPSTTGFTPGEGALQCVIGEENVGFCTGNDTSQQAKELAYNMCSGQPNAIQPTHATITATIVIQTAAPSSTVAAKTISSKISSTTDVRSSSRLTLTKSTMTATASSSTQTVKATTSPQESSQVPQPGPPTLALSKSQIIGIVVGGVGVVAVAVGSVLLLACMRRRRMKRLQRERDSDLFPFQESPLNSMENGFPGPVDRKQGTPYAPGGTLNGVAAKVGHRAPSPMTVVPRIPPRVLTDPNMFSRRLISAEEIGLAISPETKANGDLRRKPSLRLITPGKAKIAVTQQQDLNPPTKMPVGNGQNRESTATIFEMDSVVTPYEPSYHNYIHHSPRTEWPPNQPLANSMMLPAEAAIKPLQIRKSHAPNISQLSVNTHPFSHPLQQRTAASSIYSAYPSYMSDYNSNSNISANNHITNGPWVPPNPNRQLLPEASEYTMYNPYEQELLVPTRPHEIGREDVHEPRTPDARTAELTPVQESPVGKSPVSYPRIPTRLSDPAMKIILASQPSPDRQVQYIPYRNEGRNRIPPPLQPKFMLQSPLEILDADTQIQRQEGGCLMPNSNNLSSNQELSATRSSSQTSNYSMKSTTSSLQTKRREKLGKTGHSLTIASSVGKSREKPSWRVLSEEAISAAKSPDWVPQSGRPREMRTEVEKTDLPATPSWKPRLTPTKRGDDLILSVR